MSHRLAGVVGDAAGRFPTWGYVIAGAVVVVAVGTLLVLYLKNDTFKEAVDSGLESIYDVVASSARSKTLIRKVSPAEMQQIMAHISSVMVTRKFVPESQTPGLYVYGREEPRGCLMVFVHSVIAVLLLACCILPGVLYIIAVARKGSKTNLAQVHVLELPQGYDFDIDAPGSAKRQIIKILEPYRAAAASAQMAPTPVLSSGPAATAPPPPSGTPAVAGPPESGVISRDVEIGGRLAFHRGDRVIIEAVSPDPQRPRYKYVVASETIGKKFRLSDDDIALYPE